MPLQTMHSFRCAPVFAPLPLHNPHTFCFDKFNLISRPLNKSSSDMSSLIVCVGPLAVLRGVWCERGGCVWLKENWAKNSAKSGSAEGSLWPASYRARRSGSLRILPYEKIDQYDSGGRANDALVGIVELCKGLCITSFVWMLFQSQLVERSLDLCWRSIWRDL